jgi:hypothetical protein
MRVHFWGTRGSIPAALTASDVREKVVAALLAASGRTIDTPQRAHASPTSCRLRDATFGGNSSCVELRSEGAPRVLCDMDRVARSGLSAARACGQAR